MADQTTQTIIVKAPVEEVFAIWANFESFPNFMSHITSVTKTDERTSHWVMEGPLGVKIKWDAETTTLEPHTRIAWNSRDNGDITTSGQVLFTELGQGETEITVTLKYVPPGGAIGQAVAKLLDNPETKLHEDLQRFKAYAEGRA